MKILLKYKIIIIATISFILIFGYLIHFRYSYSFRVEINRFVGFSQKYIELTLGSPDKIFDKYNSVGLVPNIYLANKTMFYKTYFGYLYVYYKDDKCVESIYFGNNVQF